MRNKILSDKNRVEYIKVNSNNPFIRWIKSIVNMFRHIHRIIVSESFFMALTVSIPEYIMSYKIRPFYFRILGVKIYTNVAIGKNLRIRYPQSLTLEDNVKIGNNCMLLPMKDSEIIVKRNTTITDFVIIGGIGSCYIGEDSLISPFCHLVSHNHSFGKGELIRMQPGKSKGPIHLEGDNWLGSGVKVLDGVTIEKGVVVGAGAVVTKDLDAYGIYAGVPAKKIGARD